jgi:hypothetical protein
VSDLSDQADQLESLRTPTQKGTLADQANQLQALRSSKTEDAANPTGTTMENVSAAAGKGVTDLIRGGKQLLDYPAKWLEAKFPGISEWSQSAGFPSAAASSAQTNQDVAESRQRDQPLMDTTAGKVGYAGGQIAATMIPLAAAGAFAPAGSIAAKAAPALLNPSTYGTAAASGAAQGALQPVTGDDSRLLNTGVGAIAGAGGNALVNTIGRFAQPTQAIVSAAHDKAVQVLQNAGVPLDAAQLSGSTFLNKIRSGLSDNPFTAGNQAALAAQQKAAYNSALLKTIGSDATAATPDVMGHAADRINGVFSDILGRNNITIGDNALSNIAQIQKAALEVEKKPVSNIANRIVDSVGPDGTVPGQVMYGIKKDLDRLAGSQDSDLAFHARQLRSTVMDTINQSLNGDDQAAFQQARQQFANMKNIEPAIDKMGSGDISAARLAGVLAQKRNRGFSVYGQGNQDLVDLAHSGNMLLPDKTNNSGTVTRALVQMAAPLAVGTAEGAYTGDWTKAAGTAASLYALPKAAQFIMNNPATAGYLTRGMTGAATPLRNLMITPQTNPAIGGALRRLPQALEQE